MMAQSKLPSCWLKLAVGILTPLTVAGALTAGTAHVVTFLAVHPPRERISKTPARLGLAFKEASFSTSDGIQLQGWFIPSPYSQAAVILGHGFSRSRQEMLDVAAMLNRNCYNVLLFDWRAHGESGGTRTTFGYDEVNDLAAALDYVASQPEVDSEHIGVLGKSMGAVIAIRAAAALPQLKAVVSDSAFPSLQDSIEVGVRRRGPFGVWPVRPVAMSLGVMTMGIDPELVRPIDDIGDISPRPVLIIQGGRDELVPANTGERLYAAAAEPKFLWYVPDATHVTLSSQDPAEYEARVVAFFNAALKEGVVGSCAAQAAVPIASLQR
jgi:alpha-beta hydrolase superfamily lysophospholipase